MKAFSVDYPGNLFVVAAPSGTGKSSLVKALLELDSHLEVSISHTTRAPRGQEQHGREYWFIGTDTFRQMAAQGDFFEWAEVHGNLYGTSQQWVVDTLKQGIDVILEIDWQGAEQVRKLMPDTVSLFILPPSLACLRQRLLHGFDLRHRKTGVGYRNGDIDHAGRESRSLDIGAGGLVSGFILGPVVDDQSDAQRLGIGDLGQRDQPEFGILIIGAHRRERIGPAQGRGDLLQQRRGDFRDELAKARLGDIPQLDDDCRTIGGYPRLGALTPLSLARLAQCQSGQVVRLAPVLQDTAHRQHVEYLQRLGRR